MTDALAIPTVEQFKRLENKVDQLLAYHKAAQIQPRPEWLTADAACEELGVSKSTLDRLVRKGKVEKHGAGKARRYRVR